MNKRLFFFLFFIGGLLSSLGISSHSLSDGGRVFQMRGVAVFTEDTSLSPAYPVQASFSSLVSEKLFVGLTGSYWFTKTSLRMTTLGALLGIQMGNPRIRYRIVGVAEIPIGSQEGLGKEPLFEAKIQTLLKFNRIVSWNLEAGLLFTESDFPRWSGPFLGTGLGIHF